MQMPKRDYGMDLAAINIQRGRDHGIPPYNQWRKACGLTPFQSWSDMVVAMSPQSVDHLSTVYEHVDDVDLFTGKLFLMLFWRVKLNHYQIKSTYTYLPNKYVKLNKSHLGLFNLIPSVGWILILIFRWTEWKTRSRRSARPNVCLSFRPTIS